MRISDEGPPTPAVYLYFRAGGVPTRFTFTAVRTFTCQVPLPGGMQTGRGGLKVITGSGAGGVLA